MGVNGTWGFHADGKIRAGHGERKFAGPTVNNGPGLFKPLPAPPPKYEKPCECAAPAGPTVADWTNLFKTVGDMFKTEITPPPPAKKPDTPPPITVNVPKDPPPKPEIEGKIEELRENHPTEPPPPTPVIAWNSNDDDITTVNGLEFRETQTPGVYEVYQDGQTTHQQAVFTDRAPVGNHAAPGSKIQVSPASIAQGRVPGFNDMQPKQQHEVMIAIGEQMQVPKETLDQWRANAAHLSGESIPEGLPPYDPSVTIGWNCFKGQNEIVIPEASTTLPGGATLNGDGPIYGVYTPGNQQTTSTPQEARPNITSTVTYNFSGSVKVGDVTLNATAPVSTTNAQAVKDELLSFVTSFRQDNGRLPTESEINSHLQSFDWNAS
jgi:hypothetical protein